MQTNKYTARRSRKFRHSSGGGRRMNRQQLASLLNAVPTRIHASNQITHVACTRKSPLLWALSPKPTVRAMSRWSASPQIQHDSRMGRTQRNRNCSPNNGVCFRRPTRNFRCSNSFGCTELPIQPSMEVKYTSMVINFPQKCEVGCCTNACTAQQMVTRMNGGKRA